MQELKNLIRRFMNINAGLEEAVLERELRVPTMRRSREGFNANYFSSFLKY